MRYLPQTADDIRQMLDAVGAREVDELFATIPEELRLNRSLDLPEPLAEASLAAHMKRLGGTEPPVAFLGAGVYQHHIATAVDPLLQRSEFYTAYTPYQPEVSQGTLQAIFEFQTAVCELYDMEVANASMYDGGSAAAEAILMATRIQRKRKHVVMARSLHPEYRDTCRTYLHNHPITLGEVPFDPATGRTDLDALREQCQEAAAVVVQYPNFLGAVEPLEEIAQIVHEAGSLLIVAVAEPVALGALTPPGTLGADIVVGEGTGIGVPVGFGGPGLGLFAAREKHVRQMPGRLVGETVDADGQRAYVLTLATREQHIRREKATSNICSNQGLMALAFAIQSSLLGPDGLRRLALQNAARARYARDRLAAAGLPQRFSAPFFNEFAVRANGDSRGLVERLREQGMVAGLPLGRFYPELEDSLLVCFTEVHGREQIDRLAEAAAALRS